VGRTTALVSCAWQLAAAGKRVCIIDLDLEAPGLASLLNVQTGRGVLDFLVDFIATGSSSLKDCHASAAVMGDDAVNVDVIPAGKIDLMYLEKLARLDFVGAQTFGDQRSPVQKAMEALLGKVHGELGPEYILLDSRAGLHDLAGLSLHGLAHVDVIVARASEQSYAGVDLTLQAIGIRKDVEKLLTVILHSFAPPDEESSIGKQEREAFRNRIYSHFVTNIYSKLTDDDPQMEDTTAPHSPVVIAQNQHLERFASISSPKTKEALFGGDFVELLSRIEELCNVSTQETEDEEL
jgi:MinD-like ATPase involved in chromosome partitioning or flagellar assembly